MGEVFALLGVLLVLFLVLAASYYSTRLVGRYLIKTSGGGTNKEFSVLRRLPLGRDQQLMVVRLGERDLLLSSTPSSIQLITELSPEESLAVVPEDTTGQSLQMPNFSQWMAKAKAEKKDE